MLGRAREYEERGEGRFVEADALRAAEALAREPAFGLAICLGNLLPHIHEEAEIDALVRSVSAVLRPGGLLLVQILNYRRILDQGIRALPVNVRPGDQDDEEIVFLRLLKPQSDRRILFFPTTLVLRSQSAEPVEVRRTRRVELRPWTAGDLVPALERAGFHTELHGDMEGGGFREQESHDLVLLGTRG
jgi:SAM-dependent methyltransferase